MKWCERCRQRAYKQKQARSRQPTSSAAADLLLHLCEQTGDAHGHDVADPLEDDVPEATHSTTGVVVEGTIAAPAQAVQAATGIDDGGPLSEERQAADDLTVRRWTIVRQHAPLVALSEAWWERCGISAAARQGIHWSNLRVQWTRTRASQQRSADTLPTAELRTSTELVLRELLRSAAVPHVDELHCCTIKVLRSPPLAGRQRLHVDVPSSAALYPPHSRQATAGRKAPRCVSVVLHLNPGVTRGTHVPLPSAADMAPLMQSLPPDEWAAERDRLCVDQNFASHDMQGGDALVFYGDVAHYGPANPSATDWRWVLFVMFSPEPGPDQDAEQEYLS